MNLRFEGKTVVVTGAAHGLGRAIAEAFAVCGARVWGCDIEAEELAETGRLCGRTCVMRPVDVSDAEQVRDLVAAAEKEAGQVHVLVNNAGGVRGQVGRPIEMIAPQEWRAIFDVNVTGAFYFSQAVTPAMKRGRFGRIVNISSRAGLEISLTGIQAYASAKAAQIGLTRQLAQIGRASCRERV